MPGEKVEAFAALGLHDRQSILGRSTECRKRISEALESAQRQGLPGSGLAKGRPEASMRLAIAGSSRDDSSEDSGAHSMWHSRDGIGLESKLAAALSFLLAEPVEGSLVKAKWFTMTECDPSRPVMDVLAQIPDDHLNDLAWSVSCEKRHTWVKAAPATVLDQVQVTARHDADDASQDRQVAESLQDQAFEALTRLHRQYVESFARKIGCRNSEIDSVTSEMWQRVWLHYWSDDCSHRYSAQCALRTLWCQYVRFIAKEHHRDQAKRWTPIDGLVQNSSVLQGSKSQASIHQALIDCANDHFRDLSANSGTSDAARTLARNHTIYLLHRVYKIPQNRIHADMLPQSIPPMGRSAMAEFIARVDKAIAPRLKKMGFEIQDISGV